MDAREKSMMFGLFPRKKGIDVESLRNEPEKVYEGKLWKQLDKIRDAGRVVAPTVYFILERLMNGRKIDEYHCDVGDFIAEHPDGRYKIVLDAFSYPEFMDWGRIRGRDFVLYDGVFESLPGVEFNDREQLGRDYPLEEALASRQWRMLARQREFVAEKKEWDARLLEKYCRRLVFSLRERAMNIYLEDAPKRPRFRVASFGGIWEECSSGLYCPGRLETGIFRLVGLAPEVLKAARRRSFKYCERLALEQYPMLCRDLILDTQRRERETLSVCLKLCGEGCAEKSV